MLEHFLSFSVIRIAKVFNVSRSGFYYWLKHRHKVTRQELDVKVKEAFDNSKGRDRSDVSRKNSLRAVMAIMLKP